MAAAPLYDQIGIGYRANRIPDARIGAQLHAALGDAVTVLNVGAGAGAYEPTDRRLLALEPSQVMLAQRPSGAAPAVCGFSDHLPFADGAFDAALAILTVHHWAHRAEGFAELARVSRRQVVFCFEPPVKNKHWLVADYLPEIEEIPVPADCTDGFQNAYWCRPERYLDPVARSNISTFATIPPDRVDAALRRLAADLADGTWHRRHGHLLDQPTSDGGYRLVVVDPVT